MSKNTNKSNFKYATPTTAASLALIGFVSGWRILITVGFVLGLVWMYQNSKDDRKLRTLWWVVIVLLIAREAYVISAVFVDIRRFF